MGKQAKPYSTHSQNEPLKALHEKKLHEYLFTTRSSGDLQVAQTATRVQTSLDLTFHSKRLRVPAIGDLVSTQ
jgi:hypothetical protein